MTGCGDKRKKVKDHAEILKLVARKMVASSNWEQIKKQKAWKKIRVWAEESDYLDSNSASTI